jgi:hypothetical protein
MHRGGPGRAARCPGRPRRSRRPPGLRCPGRPWGEGVGRRCGRQGVRGSGADGARCHLSHRFADQTDRRGGRHGPGGAGVPPPRSRRRRMAARTGGSTGAAGPGLGPGRHRAGRPPHHAGGPPHTPHGFRDRHGVAGHVSDSGCRGGVAAEDARPALAADPAHARRMDGEVGHPAADAPARGGMAVQHRLAGPWGAARAGRRPASRGLPAGMPLRPAGHARHRVQLHRRAQGPDDDRLCTRPGHRRSRAGGRRRGELLGRAAGVPQRVQLAALDHRRLLGLRTDDHRGRHVRCHAHSLGGVRAPHDHRSPERGTAPRVDHVPRDSCRMGIRHAGARGGPDRRRRPAPHRMGRRHRYDVALRLG